MNEYIYLFIFLIEINYLLSGFVAENRKETIAVPVQTFRNLNFNFHDMYHMFISFCTYKT